jgi:1A family penicillin-binding protein
MENPEKKIQKRQLLTKIKTRFLPNQKKVQKRFIVMGVILAILLWLFWGLPLPTSLTTTQYPVSTKIYDRNDKLIYEIFAEQKRTPIELQALPDYVWQATIAIEDKDFYKHYGFSPVGIVRAVYNTIFKQKLQGGSTLTQQLVKITLLNPERTVRRKIREFMLSVVVETIYSKDKILELYLNQIPYGGTAYGIEAAAENYFDKEARQLTLAEAALLAGLPQAPSRYSPFTHPDNAKARQQTVLRRMVEDGYITADEAEKATAEELKFAPAEKVKAAHFALWVKEQLAEEYGEAVVERGGLRVKTTLDLELQEFAEEAVATEVAKLTKAHVGNGAALVTRPKTGEILAMVGSKDYFAEDEDGKVNIIFAQRQPGSSIKPLNYALAFKDHKITPATAFADVPTCFAVAGQAIYCPRNYDGTYHGLVQARFALGSSYNIPAVRVLALNGLDNFVDFARQMGLTTLQETSNYGLSLTLGGGEVRPYDMAQAFGTLANGGIKQPLVAILEVKDWKGKVLKETDLENQIDERILDPEVPFLISHILLDNNARAPAFGTASLLNVRGHPEVSVKTGTTNDRRDNWTIGYTAHIATVVWVGNNDNSPMSGAVSGVSGASPIWNKIMRAALDKAEEGIYNSEDQGHAWPQQPEGVTGMEVCVTTGTPPGAEDADCPKRFEYFLSDNLPQPIEKLRHDIPIDKTKGTIARPNTPPENIETQNHPTIWDPLKTIFCLDCPIPPQEDTVTIRYPL